MDYSAYKNIPVDFTNAPKPHIDYAALATGPDNAYYKAHMPEGYPDQLVYICAQRHVNLPPNFRELCKRARQYEARITGEPPYTGRNDLYDWSGEYPVELDQTTGEPADWPPLPELAQMPDIPGPLADPMTWEAPPEPEEEGDPDVDNDPTHGCLSSVEAFLRYMHAVGRANIAFTRIPMSDPRWAPMSDREVAETILREFRD